MVLAVLGLMLWIAELVPPLSTWARRFEFAQAIQFGVFAFAVPVLLVSGAQWRSIGLASRELEQFIFRGRRTSSAQPHGLDRVAASRTGASHQHRAVLAALAFAALTIFWRVAPVVDYLVTHPWLVVVESLSLICVGVLLFVDLVESSPLMPGASRPYRIGIAAGVMWTAWVVAYLNGMSNNSWYHAFRHVAGQGVSLSADQQLSAGFIWLVSGAVFVPIIFWNLVYWLQSEEDPSEELSRLVRDVRTRGFFGSD
jgi:cytochrome c oxidase assembly factor CtaG